MIGCTGPDTSIYDFLDIVGMRADRSACVRPPVTDSVDDERLRLDHAAADPALAGEPREVADEPGRE